MGCCSNVILASWYLVSYVQARHIDLWYHVPRIYQVKQYAPAVSTLSSAALIYCCTDMLFVLQQQRIIHTSKFLVHTTTRHESDNHEAWARRACPICPTKCLNLSSPPLEFSRGPGIAVPWTAKLPIIAVPNSLVTTSTRYRGITMGYNIGRYPQVWRAVLAAGKAAGYRPSRR